jgi:hypothetical protein
MAIFKVAVTVVPLMGAAVIAADNFPNKRQKTADGIMHQLFF